MRRAVDAVLTQWFAEQAGYEKTVEVWDLKCLLKGMIDPVSRVTMTGVEIVSPPADVAMGENEFPWYRGVTFA